MALVTKNDVTQIFAIQAPSIDLPPTFANYPRGWDTARSNNGKPTIKQFNYIQQRTDQNVLWIHQNGAALPYDATMEYAENAHVVKDGELQKKQGASWVSAANKGYNLDYFVDGKSYPLHAEIMLENGDIVRSTIPNNINDPNVDMTGWVGTGIYTPIKTPLASSINRALYDHVTDQVNVKDYGAIGDGTLHTVQEWIDSGKFSSLADIQTEYPHVTALTDSVDWAAMQLCINMRKNVYTPSGTYVTNRGVDTPHSGSPNRVDTNICIFGDGIKTIFTRNAVNQPATRILDVNDEDDVTAFDDIMNAEAFFSVHGCYYKFTDCMFQNNRVGIYFGQDLRNLAEKSVCYFNAVRDVVFRKNGTSIVMSSSGGNHYNNFQNIHFIEGQIDFEMIKGKYDATGIANNNRNYFNNLRSNRSKVGLWCKSGDTNTFNAWHGENCGANPVNNGYPAVTGLPKLLSGVQITNAVHIIDKLGQLNTISNSKMEACEIELFNNQVYSSFNGNRYHESTENGTQVYNLKEVGAWLSAETMVTPYFAYLSNANINAFPTIPTAGLSFRGGTPVRDEFGRLRTSTPPVRNNTGRVITKMFVNANSYSEKRLHDLGTSISSELKTVTIWDDIDASSSANIKVRVSTLSTASNLSFLNEFVICANRSSTRALSRYFLSEISKLRASGQGAGDSATVIVPTIVHGGASTRELILNLQMPAYAMDSILVEVEMMVNKA